MKKSIYIIFFTLFAVSVSAQVRGVVINTNGEPLFGVNVFWAETTIGATTNENGEFTVSQTPQSNRLVFSSVLFNNDTITVSDPNVPIYVTLNEVIELEEFTVVQQRMGVLRPRTAILQTETITTHELSRAACCNLSEAFETNPSVDVIFSDAATGAKQIRLLGLSGAYVQMLTENIPNLRGISSVYGLGFIPGPWIESIHVVRGAGSVINGHEAITGQINVEYKKPHTSERLFANMFFSDMGRVEANVNASAIINDRLSTGILLHASDDFINLDHDNDDFLDKPRIRQFNVANRWFYTDGNYISQLFVRGLHENRRGGQIVGDPILGRYRIGIETARYEFFTKNGYVFNHARNTSIGLILSGSHHEQNAFFGHTEYRGTQGNVYTNLIFHTDFTRNHRLSAGTSYNFDNFNENVFILGETPNLMSRREHTPGAFAEYTFCNGIFSAVAGLRGDYNSYFDRFFVTPRLHLRFQASEHIHLRASAGKGYRSPNIWAENNFLLASSRRMIVADNLQMEEAWNYGFSVNTFIPLFGRELRLMGEWFYTDFTQQTVIDMDADANEVRFYNLDGGRSFANNFQFEANMEIANGLTATLAHRITDTRMTINGVLREKPFVNRYRSMITASYQTPRNGWQFDFTTQFHGGGRLPDPSESNPLWEKEFGSFTTMMAQITRHFRAWSVYLGSENLTGFVQHNPIIGADNPFGSDFDATMIWGPTVGRMLYVGFNWTLDKK